MCGIAGYIDKTGSQINATLLKDMTDRISHRGPDGHGVHCVENVGIAHRRLSIIDLASGAQPMCNEDGSVWITFNGELYNYLELQKQLKAFGHIFKTNSDTEVIIHAYEQWGTDCLRRLRGMFAFAIADEKKKKLLIVRDQFGIKPVFYFVSEKGLAFASELQAFKAIPHFNPEIDIKALDQYLLLQYIPAPLTIFENVYKLKPAHYIEVGFNGSISEQRQYWDYSFRPNYSVKDSDWIEIIEEQIKESVKAHLVSDVPFGAFLSGGIDSSLVVTHMSQILDKPVKTFSIGFKEEEYNELRFASMVAKKCGTEHFTEIIEPDAISILPQLVKHYGEPFADSSAIPTYYVSKLARKHVTMALSGDGGDELFAGYSSYAQWLKQNPISYYSGIKKTAYTYLNKILPSKISHTRFFKKMVCLYRIFRY